MRNKLRVTVPLLFSETIAPETQKCVNALKECSELEVRIFITNGTNILNAKNNGINNNRSDLKHQEIYDFGFNLILENGLSILPADVNRLINHNVHIVCALDLRNSNSQIIQAGFFGFYEGVIIDEKRLIPSITGLQKVDWVDTGIFVIKNSAYSQMKYPWFRNELITYFDENAEEHQFSADENMGLCINAKRSDLPLYCDTDCTIEHSKDYQRQVGISLNKITEHPVQCPICLWEGEKFLDVEYDSHIYPNAECPKCLSQPRQRLFAFYWKHKIKFGKHDKFLHISPSPCEEDMIRKSKIDIEYLSVDIDPQVGMDSEDLTNLSYNDNSFDKILCFHVLEHIDNDKKAISELFRVLKHDGIALVMVPLNIYSDTTLEDSSIVDPKERMKVYWHWDHVRLYGNDFKERLTSAGFDVSVVNYYDSFSGNERKRYGFEGDEFIFVCKKLK